MSLTLIKKEAYTCKVCGGKISTYTNGNGKDGALQKCSKAGCIDETK